MRIQAAGEKHASWQVPCTAIFVKYRLIDAVGPRTYIVILDRGDEIATSLKHFAEENKLEGSSFKAIGALSSAKVGWFNWQTKKYDTAAHFHEQLEVLSLIGDIALKDGKPTVHAHLIVGRSDGTAHGGHLLEAHVRPTLEVVLTESAQTLEKTIDPESGLALIQP
jgi:predicted DNA-binding protein with PD1-like motif